MINFRVQVIPTYTILPRNPYKTCEKLDALTEVFESN